MKILFINNYNYLKGGAESVFLKEKEIFSKKNHSVSTFSRKHSKNLSCLEDKFFPSEMMTDKITLSSKSFQSLFDLVYSLEAKKLLNKMLLERYFDVAHLHNIYGRLTSSILDCLKQKNIPALMTLHDYKVICPNYKLMHHGKICEDCFKNSYYHAILNKCHKDSYIASTIYSFETYFNYFLKKYKNNIKYFISPSKFLKNKMVEFGWNESAIIYIPNFVSTSDLRPQYTPGKYFLYLGRLSLEKGIRTLIKAFMMIKGKIELKIVGEGPLEVELKEYAKIDKRIEFLGYLSGERLEGTTKNALAVVVPSEWYENAPLSVLEAMAYGKPVIGANLGGIPEMILERKTGLLFQSGDAFDLKQKLCEILGMTNNDINLMGRLSRERVEIEYNVEKHYSKLVELYIRAMLE